MISLIKQNLVSILIAAVTVTVYGGGNNPAPPVLDYVTVNHSDGTATLFWSASPSDNVTGYVVYRYRNGEGYVADTIPDATATSYTDNQTGALHHSESYVVAALGSDETISPLSNPVSTIFIEATIDTCALEITVKWNPIVPGVAEILNYEVISKRAGHPDSVTVIEASGKTELVMTGFSYDSEYRFKIAANLSDGSRALSNKTTLSTTLLRPPGWIETDYITTTESNTIEISVSYDPGAQTDGFEIKRGDRNGELFQTLSTVRSTGGQFIYEDTTADTEKSYHYKISALNSCNEPVISTSRAGNIVLQLLSGQPDIGLAWKEYQGWTDGVARYEVRALFDNNYDSEIVAALSPSDTLYSFRYEDIMLNVTGDRVQLFVKAVKGSGNNDGEEVESISNMIEIAAVERVTVPTAFRPGDAGINAIFRPVLSFTPLSYRLIVRSRSGATLFETADFMSGWDGTTNGTPLPPDIYLWSLQAETPAGRRIERSGTVALIYN